MIILFIFLNYKISVKKKTIIIIVVYSIDFVVLWAVAKLYKEIGNKYQNFGVNRMV